MTRQAIPAPPMQAAATTPKTTKRFVMTFAPSAGKSGLPLARISRRRRRYNPPMVC
jgi:hypothetical protein